MDIEREFLPEKRFMLRALELAREAGLAGEVPVGALVREPAEMSELAEAARETVLPGSRDLCVER